MSDTARPPPSGGRVMIIHEADAARSELGAALTAAGIEPLLRTTTIGAQAQILRERPDVVVIDASMPLMSGAELTRALRAHGSLRHTTILLSGASTDDLTQMARECGADGMVAHGDASAFARALAPWIARGRGARAPSLSGFVLVACGQDSGRELGRMLQEHVAARVTDSGNEALRLVFSRDAPALVLLGTELTDMPPARVHQTMLERDRRWAQRLVVVREQAEVPDWAADLPLISPSTSIEEVVALLARVRSAPS